MNDMKKIWIVSLLLLGCFAARAQAPAPLKGRIAVSVPPVSYTHLALPTKPIV